MSKPPRFFIAPEQVSGTSVTITGEDLHHIRTVLRKQPGDLLVLLDGKGGEYTVRITTVGKTGILAETVDRKERRMLTSRVVLCQGIAKSDKMDWIVQKATELGVSGIVPLVTERTIVKVKDEEKRLARWQKVAREAAMQSDRPDIPGIESIHAFSDFLVTLDAGPMILLLMPWEEATTPIKEVLRSHPEAKTIVVLIGPEGGFSQAEADAATSTGFHLVSLGPNILRTETAAIAVLSMIGYETGA